jgi:hypothetical protein
VRRIAVLVVVALFAGACAGTPAATGGLTVLPLDGEVRLLDDDGPLIIDELTEIEPGTMVATGSRGRALVHLGAAGTLELGSQAQVRIDARPQVVRGSVLARAADPGLGVRAGDAEVQAGDGSVFRVDGGFSVRVAVYRGAAEVLGSGIDQVQALRQATVLEGGVVPRGPEPLEVRPDHPWDIRLLGAAIDLGLDLDEIQRGLTRQLPGRGADIAVMRVLDGAIPARKVQEILGRVAAPETVAAAETMVAAEVSRDAARLSQTPVVQVLDDVVDFRMEGAHWIVVVAQWGLGGAGLLQGLQELAGVIERLLAGPPTTGTAGGGGPTGGAGGTSGGGSTDVGSLTSGSEGSGGSGGATGGSDGTGGSGDSTTGGSEPSPPPDPGCGNPVGCLVGDLIKELDSPLPGGGGGGEILP